MKKNGSFFYESYNGKKVKKSDYSYDDDWFREDAEKLSPPLCIMSLELAMACFPEGLSESEDVHTNGEELLSDIGYEDISVNEDYRKPPTEESLGLIAAHREMTDKDGSSFSLIMLSFRGASFGPEWAKNIILGESHDAEGFRSLSKKTKTFLEEYLSAQKNKLHTKKKYWITGYSRAAAIAGLIGADISADPKAYDTDISGIFVYTFESPMVIDAGEECPFKNIHNIINPDDLVPRIAPAIWGFCRPGTDDLMLPKKRSDLWRKNIKAVKARLEEDSPDLAEQMKGFQPYCIQGGAIRPLKGLDFPMGNKGSFFGKAIRIDQKTFLNIYIKFMASKLTESTGARKEDQSYRKTFVSAYQKSFAFCAKAYLGAEIKKRDAIRRNLLELAKLLDVFAVKASLYLKLKYGGKLGIKNVENSIIREVIKRLKKDPIVALSESGSKELTAHIRPLVHYFIYCASLDIRFYRFFFTSTFLNNMWKILACHAPETTLAWLKTLYT